MDADPKFNGTDDVFERLHGDARMNPIADDVLDISTPEGIVKARELVNLCVIKGWATASDLSHRTGIPQSAISAFRNDKWGKRSVVTLAKTAGTLARAINQVVKEREAKKTEVGGFVTTRLAEAIFDIVHYAIKRRKIAVFLVNAGLGKTMALDALIYETPGTIKLTVTGARSTVKSFLQLWARALNLNETGRTEDIQDRIANALEGSSRLILIDEAHKLRVSALDAMREIWDQARVPIVLAATPILYQTISARRIGSQQSELMDQFYSRVGIFRDLQTLQNPTTGDTERIVNVEDIRKVFARGHVRLARDGADFLCRLANTPGAGGYRVCRDLVQMAVDLYPDETLTAARMQEMLVMRLGIKEAGFRMDSAEIERTAVAATA